MLNWNKEDFIDVLGVIPREGEILSVFTVEQDALRLKIFVETLNLDVTIQLFASGVARPILDIALLNCIGAKSERNYNGSRTWLEFYSEETRVWLTIEPQIHIQVRNDDVWTNFG